MASQKKTASAANTKPEVKVPKTRTVSVDITVPVLEHGTVMLRHLEFKLSPRQSKALRFLFDGLVAESQTMLLGGSTPEKVVSQPDALRWVLDQIADATE